MSVCVCVCTPVLKGKTQFLIIFRLFRSISAQPSRPVVPATTATHILPGVHSSNGLQASKICSVCIVGTVPCIIAKLYSQSDPSHYPFRYENSRHRYGTLHLSFSDRTRARNYWIFSSKSSDIVNTKRSILNFFQIFFCI